MSEPRPLSVALFGIILNTCSPAGTATDGQPISTLISGSKPIRAAMSASKSCPSGNLHRSKCMIELILADVEREYGGIDGGGIDAIRAPTSTSFTVSLSFEERVVTWTYEFDVQDGSVAIKTKTEAVKSFKQ